MALVAALGQGNPDSGKPKITLTAVVSDKDHHVITGLNAEQFVLYEDDQPQQILSVNASVSACIGLLLDSSGSMRHKRDGVIQALSGMVRAGASNDRIFVVNFNNDAYLDQAFTSDPVLIEKAMSRMDPRGGTALYDAVIASTSYFSKGVQCEKRVLVAVTDGDDNSSQESLQHTIDILQYATSPLIYIIGMENESTTASHNIRDSRALETLTAATGGTLFFANGKKDLDKAALKIAAEIQNEYVITYVSAAQQGPKKYRKIKVGVRAPEQKDVVIRVKPGLYH